MVKNRMNIFSSCDRNYFKHIPTLLISIHENLSEYDVYFYFIHANIEKERIEATKELCNKIDIHFIDIIVSGDKLDNYKKLQQLTVYSADRPFSLEGMFICLPNIDLPLDVDRALYLDAGDIIVSGDIGDYYYSNFHNNVITVSKGFGESWSYTAKDIYDIHNYLYIASEYFNSGSVLFNVELMRKLNIDFYYYYKFLEIIRFYTPEYSSKWMPGRSFVVTDDQGLLAAAFVGRIQFYDPQDLGHINTPFNFRPFLYELHLKNDPSAINMTLESSQAKILHFIGNKPWTPIEKRKELLTISQECLALWDKYEQKANEMMEGKNEN